MQDKILQIKTEYSEQINNAKSLKVLDELFLKLFGKTGVITLLPKDFPSLSKDELKTIGPAFNQLKRELEQEIIRARDRVKEEGYRKLETEKLDLSDKKIKSRKGHLHPISEFEGKIAKLFTELRFEQFDAPHIVTDENNFELLNIPSEHPARDMWDTLYVEGKKFGFGKNELLLKTHNTAAQPIVLKTLKPPFRIMLIDRVFRYENLDARHEHTFDQFEIIYVDKGLSMANMQYLSNYLLKGMYGQDISARLSPGYYPFTEPSAHLFGTCIFCKGKGCQICGETGELELGGAGMIHPNVLRSCGLDPDVYSGIAWGLGPGRMAMLKYGINDIRKFNSGDLNFLQNLKEEK